VNPRPISNRMWDGIRAESTLPALEQVHRRLMEDPEPVMRQLVRVFIGEGTFCPGFQFLPGGRLHPTVMILFQRALELGIPHNCFTAWMITPSRVLTDSRPVDLLKTSPTSLLRPLEAFSRGQAPRP
jgi:hypothetical protein